MYPAYIPWQAWEAQTLIIGRAGLLQTELHTAFRLRPRGNRVSALLPGLGNLHLQCVRVSGEIREALMKTKNLKVVTHADLQNRDDVDK